jgi:hypothetical protein
MALSIADVGVMEDEVEMPEPDTGAALKITK